MKVLLLGNGFDLNHKFPTSYINFLNTVTFLKEVDREKISTIGHVFGSEELHKNDPFIAKCYDEHSRMDALVKRLSAGHDRVRYDEGAALFIHGDSFFYDAGRRSRGEGTI